MKKLIVLLAVFLAIGCNNPASVNNTYVINRPPLVSVYLDLYHVGSLYIYADSVLNSYVPSNPNDIIKDTIYAQEGAKLQATTGGRSKPERFDTLCIKNMVWKISGDTL